ncbi:pteridine-dependent deoxygenase [soil metagenome]
MLDVPLQVERGIAAAVAAPALGLIDWGVAGGAALGGLRVAPRVALLHAPAAGAIEKWCAGVDVERWRDGFLDCASDGQWLFASALLDEAGCGGVEAAARTVYTAIFELLERSGHRYLQRTWNYLGDINLELDGLERYRRFNIGRQDAFLAAHYPAFDGAPAACGLGVTAGPLSVHFVASAAPPVAIENPRQVSAYRYPSDYGPRSPTFSRGAIVRRDGVPLLLISGTASIVGHQSLHLGDVAAQTGEAIANLRAVVDAANAHASIAAAGLHRFALEQALCTVYIRHPDDLARVRETFESAVGATSPAARQAIYVKADVCRRELLVEIEATIAGAAA